MMTIIPYLLRKARVLAWALSFLWVSVTALYAQDVSSGRVGMLILGSANIETLQERVDIGYKLYKTNITFDYILVSGGCGAHGSAICEATEMKEALVKKGVPSGIIFKEEQSKNTVQNYVYSRMLKQSDGKQVIRSGDKLYVVSNHWHAMPVAARFSTYDGVDARYHIEGNILPSPEDKVDYTGIFNREKDNEVFCREALKKK